MFDAQEMHDMKIADTHPSRQWCIIYAGQLLVRFQKGGQDGKTSWERRRGRPYNRRLPKFLEPILYLKVAVNKRRNKFEDRWSTGLHLGLVDRSDMTIVGTSGGCIRVNSLKRLPRAQ